MRATWLALLFLVRTARVGAVSSAQEEALAPERLAALAAEALPLVREALGVELAGVEVRLGTRAEIERALRAENRAIFARLGSDPERAEREAADFARGIAPTLFAKYAFEEDDVLVQAEAFRELAALVGIPELAGEPCVRAVLLHELVHAADDERHDLARLYGRCTTTDALRATNAVVEGHAQLRARELAPLYGCVEGLETYTRAITAPPRAVVEAGGEGARLALRAQSTFFASAYLDGEAFLAALRDAGGAEAVERAFLEPPADAVLIARPEWFLAPELRPHSAFHLEPAVDAFAEEFDPDEWTGQRVQVSASDLRSLLAPLEPDEVDALAATLRQNLVQGFGNRLGQQATLALFEFGSAAEAAAYLAAYERMQRARDETMKEGAIRIVSSDYEPLAPPAPDGLLVTKRIATPVFVDVVVVCASRGPLVVETMSAGLPDWDGERLIEAATAALEETVRQVEGARASEQGELPR